MKNVGVPLTPLVTPLRKSSRTRGACAPLVSSFRNRATSRPRSRAYSIRYSPSSANCRSNKRSCISQNLPCAAAASAASAACSACGWLSRSGKLRFAYRNFPLRESHPHAEQAAEAAEAAAAQGKFWEMHDRLFERQFALDGEYLIEYAGDLGLDVARFRTELSSGAYAPRVREDFRSGVTSGVNGTPTFFINGVRHDDSWEFEPLLAALEDAAVARS